MSELSHSMLDLRAHRVHDFARSDLFDRTFREGMSLVEETATYLDGDGRRDSRLLSREDALAYAGESMRLTTRLMQIASWLLVQRAVREGDMKAEDACAEKYRLMPTQASSSQIDILERMPEGLNSLLDRSSRLFERVSHLDRKMFVEADLSQEAINPVLSQMQLLTSAFSDKTNP